MERFEVEHVLGPQLPRVGRGALQDDLTGFAARHAVAESMTNQAEIVFELGLELELFERRHRERRVPAESS